MKIYTILIFVWLFSCKEKEIPLPITKEKMVDILLDMHVMESSLKSRNDQNDSLYNLYIQQIEEIHQVSKEDIDSTITLLNKRPNEFYQIYKELGEKVNLMKNEEKPFKALNSDRIN